jgi:hypothetical protein
MYMKKYKKEQRIQMTLPLRAREVFTRLRCSVTTLHVQHCHLDSWKSLCSEIIIYECTKVCNMLSKVENFSDPCNPAPINIH